jgi:hypothetical protein
VDPEGVVAQDAERGFDLGASVAALDAQGHRQGPGQRVLRSGRTARLGWAQQELKPQPVIPARVKSR